MILLYMSKKQNITKLPRKMSSSNSNLPADKTRSSRDRAWSGGEIFAVVTFIFISCATTIFAIWYLNKEKNDSPSSCSERPYMAKWFSGPVTPIRGISSPETEIHAAFPEPFSSRMYFSCIIADTQLSKGGESHTKSVDGFKSTILTKYKTPNENEISDEFDLNSNSIWSTGGGKKIMFAGTMSNLISITLKIFMCTPESSVSSLTEITFTIVELGFKPIAHAFNFSHMDDDDQISGILVGNPDNSSEYHGIYVVYDVGHERWDTRSIGNLKVSPISIDPPCFWRIFSVPAGSFFCAGEVQTLENSSYQPSICYYALSEDGSVKSIPIACISKFCKDDSYSTHVLDIMPLPPNLSTPDQALVAYYDGTALYSAIVSGVASLDGDFMDISLLNVVDTSSSPGMSPIAHTFGISKDGIVPLYVLLYSQNCSILLMKQYNYDILTKAWDWGTFVMTIDSFTNQNNMTFNIIVIPDPWNVGSSSGAICVQNATLQKTLVLPINDDSIRATHDPFYVSSEVFNGSDNWKAGTSGTRIIFPINDVQKTQAFEIINYGKQVRLRATCKVDISYISFGQ